MLHAKFKLTFHTTIRAGPNTLIENSGATASSSSPKFTNRLIYETSPYLRQHANNPVDWYPWGAEALERAKEEDRPILLSIGYSACHWCHVMERESFENEEIAQIMNRHFVNIKVDREERPDLDTLYMNFVQMSTGSGGWPMTVFLTPGQIPFFGGTYFPPDDRLGRPGFPRLLLAIADAYQKKRMEIDKQGPEILRNLEKMHGLSLSSGSFDKQVLDSAYENLANGFDWANGGFGGAPKFPGSMNLAFCLRYYQRSGNREALRFVELTLENMGHGGIYDQLGGGFHRYSVDGHWLVPHFEKMLYDNALLSRLYLEAYQLTRKPFYRRITEEILDYVTREMTSPEGGFYSTQDADSEGEEGKFFTWELGEIRTLLGNKDSELFCRYYGVTENGNFDGTNILHVARSLEDLSEDFQQSREEVEQTLTRSRQKLFEAREKRVKPHRDQKMLTCWNGLMNVSFLEAANVLGRDDYLLVARQNVQFMLEHLCQGEQVLRSYKDGQTKINGFLEDYANLIEALIGLFEATGETLWLDHACRFNGEAIRQFWDSATRSFFLTGSNHETLITRVRDFYDNATPAGSSVVVTNLLRLAVLLRRTDYREIAESVLERMSSSMARFPSGFGCLLNAAVFYQGPVQEIVLVGSPDDSSTSRLAQTIYQQFLPNKVVARLDPSRPDSGQAPWLEGKTLVHGKPTVYVCHNYTCQSPTTDASELEHQLQEPRQPTA